MGVICGAARAACAQLPKYIPFGKSKKDKKEGGAVAGAGAGAGSSKRRGDDDEEAIPPPQSRMDVPQSLARAKGVVVRQESQWCEGEWAGGLVAALV